MTLLAALLACAIPEATPMGEAAAALRSADTPHVVWVGAHPDDESMVAPLLGALCVEEGWACTFVVATRGEGGSCNLPASACDPDLGAQRTAEMEASSALFGASLRFLELSNGPGWEPYAGDLDDVAERWQADRDLQSVVDELAGVIADADLLVTFDPRHGVTCHPEHRVASTLALLAADALGTDAPPVLLAEGMGTDPVVPADPTVWALDASSMLPTTGVPAWAFSGAVLLVHESQFAFTEADYLAWLDLPADLQRIHVADLADAADSDPAYAGVCAPSL